MDWTRNSTPEESILWFHGPAGAGKSAICKTFAENCRDAKMLLSASFLSRATTGQNYNRPLIPTIAYQLACAIPPILSHIDQAILLDPFIFSRELETQVSALIIQPIMGAFREGGEARGFSWPNVIVVDGLDEYATPEMQERLLFALQSVAQIPAFSIRIVISSRPESHLVRSFGTDPLNQMTLHLALDESVNPSLDIAYFLRSNLNEVKKSHRLKQLIPLSWPDERDVKLLVEKSSGQFIYIASVVKYVCADRGEPVKRLRDVCALTTPSTHNAYDELDALYRRIFSSLRNVQMVLSLLSFQLLDPTPTTWNVFADPKLCFDETWQMMLPADCCDSQEVLGITGLEFCDILADLDGIVLTISQSPLVGWQFRFLHASLPDFLFDEARSEGFHIKPGAAHASLASSFIQCLSRHSKSSLSIPR
ncbi:unnamed protein product [Cyclocybe aegerita]|uniref:Nephrocystin 3-like N-terminal domain-containing protein n=1 Tax=Cyclocybe aegerita TaxID=1973307 RepID=A0A8S0X5G9_CYCAE|nr:unnamed protein product [Cyclocybe aegerita]